MVSLVGLLIDNQSVYNTIGFWFCNRNFRNTLLIVKIDLYEVVIWIGFVHSDEAGSSFSCGV